MIELNSFSWALFFRALAFVESGGDPAAYNKQELAIGLYQIRPIYVQDVNRILKTNYSHADARNQRLAQIMIQTYMDHYGKKAHLKVTNTEQFIEVAVGYSRLHSGGPDGCKELCTVPYALKFEQALRILLEK